jgi:outer membrane protein OmpA-like peptidoglycan-associated protein
VERILLLLVAMINYVLKYCLITVLIAWQTALAQDRPTSDKICDCDGAELINRAGDYNMRFPGSSGLINDVEKYPALQEKGKENNSVWTTFIAPFDGSLKLNVKSKDFITMVIFKDEDFGGSGDFCGQVLKGNAEGVRFLTTDSLNNIGLSKERMKESGFMFPVNLEKGEEIYFYFNTISDDRAALDMNLSFQPSNIEEASKDLLKIVDQTKSDKYPVLTISLRDAKTGLPVRGQVVVKGTKKDNALYIGTDFLYSAYRKETFELSIDAHGYFFHDREEIVDGTSDREVVIWLEPANAGSHLNMKDIQFQIGSTQFKPGAEAQLKRLRDFLELNSDIRIEVQGHVHQLGENSRDAKKMSLSRAKKVRDYLVDSGIDKKRIEVEGYGNEHMIYPEAKFAHEEQANRRVEIKIIETEQ